jgi:FtsH-binding integral membrane protein
VLAGLLPSILPISFGYLLAHYIQYLLINGQLFLPLIGNPTGNGNWPIHLPHPFNDSYEIHTQLLPSSFYWYLALAVIILVHIAAILIAHRYLSSSVKDKKQAVRAEYPWIAAMVAYTMLSLWLLAQPLVKEKTPDSKTSFSNSSIQKTAELNSRGTAYALVLHR